MSKISIKEKLWQILENTSESFQQLKEISSWNIAFLWGNIGIIVQACKDGLEAIAELKEVFGSVVHDTEAQDELAGLLDEAIQLNAVLEAVDGMIFKLVIRAACTALAPLMENHAGNPEVDGGEVSA